MKVNDVTVIVLERDRHEELIAELRDAGARVNLIRDGDVAPSIAAAQGLRGIDMLMGVGGTPEGVISAAAIKCLGGALQGKLWPRSDEERRTLVETGFDVDRVLSPTTSCAATTSSSPRRASPRRLRQCAPRCARRTIRRMRSRRPPSSGSPLSPVEKLQQLRR